MTNESQPPVERVPSESEYVFGTWSRQRESDLVDIEDASGVWLHGSDGNRYLDFSSQLICSNLGHSAEAVVEAMDEQAKQCAYVSGKKFGVSQRARLGEKLAEVTPGDLSKSLFTMTGTEAVEAAIKIARWYTGKDKIVSRYRGYHGATNGSLSITGDPRRFTIDHEMPGTIKIPGPYPYRSELSAAETLAYVDEMMSMEGDDIAAVVVEPILGGNGVIYPPEGYLAELKEITHDHGALLVFDEIMTGFGRTGEWFAADLYDVTPDIMTLAKGMTGAYAPLAATIVSSEVADHFEDNMLAHGHTYSGHPVLCAAGVAAIETYQDQNLVERSAEVGEYLGERVEELAAAHPSVGEARGTGMFYGLDMIRDEETEEPFVTRDDLYAREPSVIDEVTDDAFDRGVYVYSRLNYFVIAPPLTITREEIDVGIETLDEALTLADDAMV